MKKGIDWNYESKEEDYKKWKVTVLFEKGVTWEQAGNLIDDFGYKSEMANWDYDIGVMRLHVPKGTENETIEILKDHEYVLTAERELTKRGVSKMLRKVIEEDFKKWGL